MRSVFALIVGWALLASWAGQAGTLAQFRTPLGDLEVELFDSDKPATVQNFLSYVQSGRYADSFMHRWVPGFVIQGGGFFVTNRFTTNGLITPIPTYGTIVNEYSVGHTFSNTYGTIAMARVGGQVNSATSQWFFNLGNNSSLDAVDGGFTVFGKLVRGTNVLNSFAVTSTNVYQYTKYSAPLNELPVVASLAGYDLVYVDITLLHVQVTSTAQGGHTIQWQSVSNKVNRVEFTTQVPPSWKELFNTNGTGQTLQFTDPAAADKTRFYRVRVDY